ncbi:hypothetical protein ACHQM5_019483 [Ranunculus cassubicifolius]
MSLFDPDSANLDYLEWDEAWYSVRLTLHGETLTVKYCDHSDQFDLHFKAADFKDIKELEDFINKFRPLSVQLQDNQCHKVSKGQVVSAAYSVAPDDIRYHDAVVTDIKLSDHKFIDEECTCTFVLYWLRGPNAGNTSDESIAKIMLLTPGNAETDPTFSSFLKICRKKLEEGSAGVSVGNTLTCDTAANQNKGQAIVEHMHSPIHMECSKKAKRCKNSISRARKTKEMVMYHRKRTGHGTFLRRNPGFAEEVHCFSIDNLEKDLAPVTIVEFLKCHLSITCSAQVFPCSFSKSLYTRGVILVDSHEDLLKLSAFLLNSAHMILSPKGRPWVIMEQTSEFGITSPMVVSARPGRGRPRVKPRKTLMLSPSLPQSRSPGSSDRIRVVSSGTTEYERGMQLKKIFLEFADYHRNLHKRFALEEGKILQ